MKILSHASVRSSGRIPGGWALGPLALAFCLGGASLAFAQQQQPVQDAQQPASQQDQVQDQVQGQNSDQGQGNVAVQPQSDQQPSPSNNNDQAPPVGADQGPYQAPQGPHQGPEQGTGQRPDYRGQQGPPPQNTRPYRLAPSQLTLAAGTVVPVRLNQWLSSDKNQPGDRFSATLEQPLVANGWVVARRGQTITGRISVAQKAGNGKPSQLGLELSELTLVDGQVLPVSTQLVRSSPVNSNGRDAAVVGTTTAIGAVIGAAAGGGEGAAIGAGAGVTAGMIGVMSNRNRATVVYPETLLTFRLEAPLQISTEQSQLAFQPVGQGDYPGDRGPYGNRPRPVADGVPYAAYPAYPASPYPYYYSPYPYYWGGYYPFVPYVGFGYYGGYRGGFRGGFRR